MYSPLPRCASGKERAANSGDVRDAGLIPGLGRSLEKEMAKHSSILAWRISWTAGGLQSIASHRVTHDWNDLACTFSPENILGFFSYCFYSKFPSSVTAVLIPLSLNWRACIRKLHSPWHTFIEHSLLILQASLKRPCSDMGSPSVFTAQIWMHLSIPQENCNSPSFCKASWSKS